MITKINGTISFEGSATFTKNGRTDECDMLTFKYWAKNGKERIYINDYKRRTIGYIDVTTGEVVINNNQGNYDSEIEMAIEGFIAEFVTAETDETETDKAQGEEQMTREQKIKNILEETRASIEEEVKNGTMAPDKKIKYRAERLISAEREVVKMWKIHVEPVETGAGTNAEKVFEELRKSGLRKGKYGMLASCETEEDAQALIKLNPSFLGCKKNFIVYAQKYEGTSPMDEFIVSQAFEKERS